MLDQRSCHLLEGLRWVKEGAGSPEGSASVFPGTSKLAELSRLQLLGRASHTHMKRPEQSTGEGAVRYKMLSRLPAPFSLAFLSSCVSLPLAIYCAFQGRGGLITPPGSALDRLSLPQRGQRSLSCTSVAWGSKRSGCEISSVRVLIIGAFRV